MWNTFSPLLADTADPPEWIDGGPRFCYLARRAEQWEFMVVDPVKGTKTAAFDEKQLEALGKALAAASKQVVEPKFLPFDRVRLDGGKVRFRAFKKSWLFDPVAKTVVPDANPDGDKPKLPRPHPDARATQFDSQAVSPDGKWEASIDTEFNVTLRNRDTDAAATLTTDGTEHDPYLPEFYWSPDSSRLVVIREAVAEKTKVTLVESTPAGGGRPRTVTFEQPQPGGKLARRRPVLLHPHEREPDRIAVPTDESLFANPYELLHLRWDRDSRYFSFVYNPRGHQFLRVVAVDGTTGKTRELFKEESKTFVDYVHKFFLRHLDATKEILWMSERDGWNHLYLMDAETGAVKKQLTKGEWVVRRVDRVDFKSREIWFWAHGVRPGEDPYHLHYCRVNLDGTGFVVLTEGDASHEVWISPDRKFFVDTYSRVDLPPVTELRDFATGKLVLKLEAGDVRAMRKEGWQVPERFIAKGRDGKTDIHGVIFRPTNFDPKKKYPVVEEIYPGPTEFRVPKKFSPLYDPLQSLAEVGFIGVVIDGMGTNWRSKAFHDVCWKNLADGGFPDRVLWLKAAAAKYPEMDLSRVGIYGGSAGGRSAVRALTHHNDVYKVAVADSGNHDDRFHHIWYGELWMGYPVGPHYKAQSNVENADKVKGKLLLVAGELDRNVDPAHTLRVAHALMKTDEARLQAGKAFGKPEREYEVLIVPGGSHCPAESPLGSRRRTDFFVRHLLGVEPQAK